MLKKEIQTWISKFVIKELPTIEANIRRDNSYTQILTESAKLLLGLHNKLCGYRERAGNAFYGVLQCFEGSYVLFELEKVFLLIYEREFGLRVKVEDVVLENEAENEGESGPVVRDSEDNGVFVEKVVNENRKKGGDGFVEGEKVMKKVKGCGNKNENENLNFCRE